ncbi:MAG: UDP-N-acetylmuramoyl-tripeptide--D-alanyl-D-alanine ligase [Lysobacteraceae bacterium]|nr:MAG: UDP-N-acetylmuramoyl-tripeptide--D-alanyl-D-alanine ligase [Xanthomonadaceae bacterium]
MKPRLLSWIAQATGGRLVGDDRTVDAVATDTRALPQGGAALFVALKGENFDGHEHVAAAANGGCVAMLVSHAVDVAVPQVVVADTERALGALAAAVQRERASKVLAITGSNGKTSVKTLLLAILEQAGGAYANPGNRNNEIGLPLAVLDAPEDARFAVYEMGAGKPGDIAYLTAIARPDVALVNNIAPAHLERMGSLLGVADTKAAIYDALPPEGVAVVNADDAFAPYFIERAQGRRVARIGLDASADISARDIRADGEGSRFVLVTPRGEVEIALSMPGRHNVRNALAAAAMALGAGATLEQVRAGLDAVQPVAGRLVAHRLRNGAVLVDDSYNANPGSLDAAIDTLAAACSPTSGNEGWLVLGDMRELGADEVALHAQAGLRAKAAGIARLYTLGALSQAAAEAFGEGARRFESHADLADALAAQLREGVRVLVKGSRGSAMDRIVKALLASDAAGVDKGEANAA